MTAPHWKNLAAAWSGVRWKGQSVRALHPFDPADSALLEAVNRAEFTINGLRNRDLQAQLYAGPALWEEQRRRSAAISRKLRLLRAHGLLHKLAHTHRYQVTEKGGRFRPHCWLLDMPH